MTGGRDLAVVAEGIGKRYRRYGKTRAFGTLKSALLGRGLSEALAPSEAVQALEDVSFGVLRGETFGVIGANGSGKSTLLKLVAGIFKPSAGRLSVNGKVSALIELGAGFHPEISGRENVVINGVMLGLTRKEVERKLPDIVAFAGLEDFIDQPVKTYSSGMYVRLGFAVAVHVDPDILVVDEVLAVGDEAFSRRCLDTIAEFSARGKTIFFVSHALGLVEELCDRALYLEHGRVKGLGETREILAAYRLDVAAGEGERLAVEHVKVQEELRAEPAAPAPRARRRAGAGAGPREAPALGRPLGRHHGLPPSRRRREGALRLRLRRRDDARDRGGAGAAARRLRLRRRPLHAGGGLRPRDEHRGGRFPARTLRRPGDRATDAAARRAGGRLLPRRRRDPLAARHPLRLLARRLPVPRRIAVAATPASGARRAPGAWPAARACCAA